MFRYMYNIILLAKLQIFLQFRYIIQKTIEKISLLLAPEFIANYPNEYGMILGGLKRLGVRHIISVSFGADITTWVYINYISKNNFLGGISQPCPAIVNYIEHYSPRLLPKLMPVHSPMMCTAIYAKKYNIYGESIADEIEYGLGSIYPMPSGLKENVYWFCGKDVFIRHVEGDRAAWEYLKKNGTRDCNASMITQVSIKTLILYSTFLPVLLPESFHLKEHQIMT